MCKMKVYELLKEKYENKLFTDGMDLFQVVRSCGGDLHLYLKGNNSPYKFTAKDVIELNFKML